MTIIAIFPSDRFRSWLFCPWMTNLTALIQSLCYFARMINVSALTFSYDESTRISFPTIRVGRGDQLLLLGESGSGKTTLLHIMGGLLRNYDGSVMIDKSELSTLSESELDQFRGRRMGFVFQKNHLITSLTVEQNLTLAPYLAGVPQDKKRIDSLLDILGLADKRTRRVTELSHGQAQRVAIARAVVNKPSILFADEPTSALDDRNCATVCDLLLDVARENGSTLIIATHDHRLKDRIANRIELQTTVDK
jgi:ABC-type lipoprotein export system ATPase subunit